MWSVPYSCDAGRAVDEVGAFGAVAAAAFVGGNGTFVDYVAAKGNNADVTPSNNAAGPVSEVITRQRLKPVARFQQTTVDQTVASRGPQVAGGAQGAGVVQVFTGDQADVGALDQRAIGRQAVIGLGHVQHRYQNLFVVHGPGFHPDDVVGQGRNLFGAQTDAQGQVEGVLAGDGVVHQVLEHAVVGGLAVEESLPGAGDHRLLDQPLFVEAIPQALGGEVRIVAQVCQQVVRAHELAHVGQRRIGLDQVLVRTGPDRPVSQPAHLQQAGALGWRGRAVAAHAEQAILPGGQCV